MGKLNDAQIRAWIRCKEHFEGRSDGGGLTLRYPETFKFPAWRYRYSIGGKSRVMDLGSYRDIGLAKARELVQELAAKVVLGIDPKIEKADNLHHSIARHEAKRRTVQKLCQSYFDTRTVKTAHIEKARVTKDILPVIGNLPVDEVNAGHIQQILSRVKKRGARTTANKVLRHGTKIFNHGIKHQWLSFNVWSAFEFSDAGGSEKPRDRWLSEEELKKLFAAMSSTKGWSTENDSAVRLLLMLGVRKMELIGARVDEFDLDNAMWSLPGIRTKTGKSIDVPLPSQAIQILQTLIWLSGSEYLFPARKVHTRMLPHISPDTVNAALSRFIKLDIPRFTIHDLRRTCRTHLERLGVDYRIGEAVLNHKVKGVEGVYNRHSYFDERKAAMQNWADYLSSLDTETKEHQ